LKEYVDFSNGPLPDVDNEEGAPFWEGTRKGELRFPQCRSCQRFHWYPCVLCPFCHSPDIEWRAVTSQPKVYTWTCVRRPLSPLFAIRGPHIVALVEFDEAPGLYLVTNLVGCQPEEVYIGMPLEVVFQKVNDKLTMPLFRPVKDMSS
jgi:uncharacterized OB-fold protein